MKITKSYTNYEIREIEEEDIDNGLLEVYRENFRLGDLRKAAAKAILKEIKTNPLHKIFVAVTNDNHGWVIGTTTLLVEPKFIFSGGKVGHIEDVSVKMEYQRRGLVTHATNQAALMGCVKTVLDCSDENVPFYQKIGYCYQDNC
jgi:glucosamine-phosphate N-acetyltransferase